MTVSELRRYCLSALFGIFLAFPLFPQGAPEKAAENTVNESENLIYFSGQTAGITGRGAAFSGRTLTISQPGIYILSGILDNGQILINAGRNDDVTLILNGVFIHNRTGPAVYSPRSKEITFILADGTLNAFSDGIHYDVPDDGNDPNAAVFIQDSLHITGGGSLFVSGNYRHGIRVQDILTVTGGIINIDSAGDALRGRDEVIIKNGNFTLNAGGDGIQSNNPNGSDVGKITIEGGIFNIRAGNDGIQAESSLSITGGVFDIFTGGGSAAAPVRTSSRGGWGRFQNNRAQQADSPSMKALKAVMQVNISGGEFLIDAEDDGVHSNGDVFISSGKLSIKTGDDGIHADKAVIITGGEIEIPVCYEGIEGESVTISGGSIYVVSSDDAINAADQSETASSFGNPMTGRGRIAVNENIFVRISGGNIDLYALTDGIDSNGNIFLEGGTVMISGPSAGMEGAIDLDGIFLITGGELITAGSVLGVSQNSTQPFASFSYGRQIPSGSIITLADSRGAVLLEYQAKTSFSVSGFSSAFFNVGESYFVFIDGQEFSGLELNSMITSAGSGGFGGGGRAGFGGFGGGWPFPPRF